MEIPEDLPGETYKAIHEGAYEEISRRVHIGVFGGIPLDFLMKIPKEFLENTTSIPWRNFRKNSLANS